jgi:hypothetical protein
MALTASQHITILATRGMVDDVYLDSMLRR